MSWFNNSFNPMLGPNDIKIEFDGSVFFEVMDPDTGEKTCLKIDSIIGQEASRTPGVGDYILREELIEPEMKEEEKKKESLWDRDFKIDLDWEEEVVDNFIEVGEIYPISSKELEQALQAYADSGITSNDKSLSWLK